MILTLIAHFFLHALMDISVGVFFFFVANRLIKAAKLRYEYQFLLAYLRNGNMLKDHQSFLDEYFKFKLKRQELLEFYHGCETCPNTICPQRDKWRKLRKSL